MFLSQRRLLENDIHSLLLDAWIAEPSPVFEFNELGSPWARSFWYNLKASL